MTDIVEVMDRTLAAQRGGKGSTPQTAKEMTAHFMKFLAAANLTIRPIDDWQDISTAPKDGTDILILEASGRRQIARWSSVDWNKPDWYVQLTQRLSGDTYPTTNVTHWRPLPAAPGER